MNETTKKNTNRFVSYFIIIAFMVSIIQLLGYLG